MSRPMPKPEGKKQTLVEFGDWSVMRYKDNVGEVFVYAEHVTGCNEDQDTKQAHWSWEHDDPHYHCWKCEADDQ